MKTFLWAAFASFLGLATSIGLFSVLYDYDQTMAYLQIGSRRMFNAQDLNRNIDTGTVSSAVLGANDTGYDTLTIETIPTHSVAKRKSPLLVPTTGIAGHSNYLYLPSHQGIDIWTNASGKGLNTGSSKGYPVYSACEGRVIRIYPDNQEIEVQCEKLAAEYADLVPSLSIKVLYSHMGDSRSKQAYHSLRLGQKLQKGELIGYQGNISSFVPNNTITHLHFGVYDISRPGKGIALDPADYIGLPTNLVGQLYFANN